MSFIDDILDSDAPAHNSAPSLTELYEASPNTLAAERKLRAIVRAYNADDIMAFNPQATLKQAMSRPRPKRVLFDTRKRK